MILRTTVTKEMSYFDPGTGWCKSQTTEHSNLCCYISMSLSVFNVFLDAINNCAIGKNKCSHLCLSNPEKPVCVCPTGDPGKSGNCQTRKCCSYLQVLVSFLPFPVPPFFTFLSSNFFLFPQHLDPVVQQVNKPIHRTNCTNYTALSTLWTVGACLLHPHAQNCQNRPQLGCQRLLMTFLHISSLLLAATKAPLPPPVCWLGLCGKGTCVNIRSHATCLWVLLFHFSFRFLFVTVGILYH